MSTPSQRRPVTTGNLAERRRRTLRVLATKRKRARDDLARADAALREACFAADELLSRSEIVELAGIARQTLYDWLER